MNIDLENLAREFNMENEPLTSMNNIIDVNEVLNKDNTNADKVISDNIGRANAILDRVITEINNSGMTPRLGEVASQLLQAINTSVSQLYTKNFNIDGLLLKQKSLQLKEREIELKEIIAHQQTKGVKNQNIIVTDRETILKMLKSSKDEIKLIEEDKKE